MKTELRLAPHSILPGAKVIEIWYNGQLIGQVTGADNAPGIRVLSKYSIKANPEPEPMSGTVPIGVFELLIGR